MPELPEVEVVRRELATAWVGSLVAEVLGGAARFAGAHALSGRTVESVGRRGKFILVDADGGVRIALHLGMTGRLELTPGRPEGVFRACWVAEPLSVVLRDPRGFGQVTQVPRSGVTGVGLLDRLGPEPWDPEFGGLRVFRFSSASSKPIKALLLEQELVAGVGNYIADESLFRARVSPLARHVSRARAARVAVSVRQVMEDSLACGGVSVRDYVHVDGSRGTFGERLQVYGRAGLPCARCGGVLRSTKVVGRTTVWCVRCQR